MSVPCPPIRTLLAGMILLATVSATRAAPITWGPATDTTGKAQFIEGNVILAFSGGTGATVTGGGAAGVQGYTFQGGDYLDLTFAPAPATGTLADSSNGAASTGDADFDAVIRSLAYTGAAGITNGTQTIGGLTPGTEYLIQVFFNDQRSCCSGRVMTFGDGSGGNVNVTAGGSGWGQHAVGTFTASGTSQVLTHATNGFGNVHVNAILVTQPGPPPSPDVPASLTATAGDTEITLDWDDNTQFGFSHFIVRRSTTAGGPYDDVPGATPTGSTFTDTGLANGTTYHYVVAAVNTLAEVSANSAEASATPEVFVPDPPTVPTGLVVSPGNNRNTLNWDDNTQPGFLEFRIQRAETMGGPYTQIGTSTNSIYSDTSAVNGTTYYYVVTAVNIDNAESAASDEADGSPSPSAEPPNFLFIITDDQDTYSIGAYRRSEAAEPASGGAPYIVDTPNMDRLAAEGMLFHQARLMGSWTGAVCTASRTCIMTGRSTWGAQADYNGAGTAASTFPGVFNRGVRSGVDDLPYATYRTCKVGNSYARANGEFTIVNDATRRGNTDGSGSEWHADQSLSHIEHWRTNHRPNGKPFLMYLGFSHPHDERNARTSPNLTGRYSCINTTNPGGIALNRSAPPAPFNLLTCTPATYPAHPFDHGHLNVRDEVSVPGVLQYRTEAVIRNEIGRNFACVDWIDRQLGRVLDKLEDPDGDGDPSDSVLDNTYIVFTSDHGIAIGRHGIQGKQNLYEHTWRVPYIVRGPGIEPGTHSDALIYLHDTFPTFCDLAGLDLPPSIGANDGRSFRAVLQGASTTHRGSVYGLYTGGSKPGMRAVTDGRFKLIKYDVGNNATQVTQMFDIRENPFEFLPQHGVANLADDPAYAGVRQDLEELLMRQRVENADPYAFLGDRSLLRFEDGIAGEPAGTLADRLPFGNHGTARSGAGGDLPVFAADVPGSTDLVVGEANTLSLDLEQDLRHHVLVPDSRSLGFGANPFTIEAWVKLEALPTGDNLASAMPVAMKKVIGAADANLDYLFLAAAGNYGSATTYNRLALVLGGTTHTPILSSLAIPDTGWHHISVALDPATDTLRFTLDDQADTQATALTGTANNGPLVIGAHYNSSGVVDSAFDGLIDEFSITDGFLPIAELQPLRAVAPAAPFAITALDLSGDGTTADLTFESNDTRLYTVQMSATLDPGSWTDVRSFIPGAAGSTTVTGLPLDPSKPGEFFRVVMVEGL